MPFTKGYTASGFRLQPTVNYLSTDSNVTISAGVLLTGIAGVDGLWKVQPVVTIDYRPARWVELTMGTLHGSLEHKMPAPLYNPERWIYSYQENGLQIRTATKHWESDTWVDWEHFLEPWTPDQERFTLASRHLLTLLGDADGKCMLQLPAAFSGSHRGGQFTTLDTCIETLMNEYAGLSLSYNACKTTTLTAEAPIFLYQNLSPTPHTHYLNGYALYPSLVMNISLPARAAGDKSRATKELTLRLGFWQAHHYQSARGSYLYQCVSWHDPLFQTPERHMLTADIAATAKQRGGLGITLNASIYHDLDLKKTDMVIGLAMQIAPRVALSNTAKQ
ncbi:MAG: hypothetical protein IJU81_05755 [Bacteroidales bacterium]|nr:hypothetical protein [Bacteroidales bacterium]